MKNILLGSLFICCLQLSTSYLRAGTFYSTTFARGNAGEEVVSKFIPFAGGNLGRTVAKDTIRNTASINFDHAKPAFRKKIFEASSLKINITQVIASSDDGNVPLNTIDMNYKTRWSALGNNQWIRYYLDIIKTITTVKIAL